MIGQRGVGRFGFLPKVKASRAGLLPQFVIGADGLHVAGLFADPDWQRRAPVAFARKGPIDVRFQEIAEAAVANVLRQPIDFGVVGQHLVAEPRRADEPALARILDERVLLRPPAERIVVQILFLMEEQPAALQVADDVLVAVLDPAALVVGRFRGELAIGTDRTDQSRPLAIDETGLFCLENVEIDFSEGRH